ncbi:MAG: hypothetical protein JWM33_2442 [Caulobacteraceae bacterium]|nr:hypothetical protein [Caulobacteraceae bacterium]
MLIRQVLPADCAPIVDVWREAAAWLERCGQPLWSPAEFTPERTIDLAERGELFAAFHDEAVVACMTLQGADPIFWNDAPHAAALYLHKLAVRRQHAGSGLSGAMIDWACGFGLERGVQALRLDCAPRPALVDLYLRNGFRPFDQGAVVRGGYEVIRLERALR